MNAQYDRLAQSIGQLVLRTIERSPFKREATVDVRVQNTVQPDGTTGVDIQVRARRWTPDGQPSWQDGWQL